MQEWEQGEKEIFNFGEIHAGKENVSGNNLVGFCSRNQLVFTNTWFYTIKKKLHLENARRYWYTVN